MALFDECDDPDNVYDLALVVARERERLGLGAADATAVRSVRRQLLVCQAQWRLIMHRQDKVPEPYEPSEDIYAGIIRIHSAKAFEFWSSLSHPQCSKDLTLYGKPLVVESVPGEHTTVVNAIATGDVPVVTKIVQEACGGRRGNIV